MDFTKLIAELKRIAAQTHNRQDSLQQVANLIRSSGNYRWVGLYDVNHVAGTVTNIVFSGPGAPEYPTFPISKGLTGGAIRGRITVNVGDVSVDPRYLTAFGTTQSEIIVPVFDENRGSVIGTIDIESERRNAFDADTQTSLERCAEEIAPLWWR